MEIAITSGLIDRIREEAGRSPQSEICGLLLGDHARITDAIPTANVAPDPARHFEVDPQALFAAIRSERAGGPMVIGHYHSHPNGSCAPSARDAAEAEPGKLWLIIAAGACGAWRSTATGFLRLRLIESAPTGAPQHRSM